MHYVLLFSLLASGLHVLPFGAAAPLPSSNTLSLKERTSNPLHFEREFSSLTSSPTPGATVHSPSFKRGLLFPPSVVNSIATSPITPLGAKKRQESPPTALAPNTVKGSEGTRHLTPRLQQGSAVEERSPNRSDDEPRGWSGLDSRSADSDNIDSILVTRANAPSTPDAAKDPNLHCSRLEPVYYVFIGIAIVVVGWFIYHIVVCIVGGKDTAKYLATWKKTIRTRIRRRAERREAASAVVPTA